MLKVGFWGGKGTEGVNLATEQYVIGEANVAFVRAMLKLKVGKGGGLVMAQ